MDFAWVATDRDGHVAWLVTCGSAVVPKWVDDAADDYDLVEEWLKALPQRGAFSTSEAPGNIEGWRTAARSGVFAYDWDVYSGPYRAIAVPATPGVVADLPPALAALARRSCFAHVCFWDRMALPADFKFHHQTCLRCGRKANCIRHPLTAQAI